MSTFVVLGDAEAAPKLVTATLNDYLDTHLATTPDDDFAFIIAVRHPVKPAIAHVISWCEKAGVYYEIEASSDKFSPPDSAADCRFPDNFMLTAVEHGYSYDKDRTMVLALVGEEDPPVDVTRALVRAVDSHMEVRDLTEGALTYIKFYGDTVDEPPEENTMAKADEEEEMTLSDLIALADEGDEEAIEALTGPCAEAGIDPDEYATWAELEELLAEALGLDGDAEEEEEPEEEPEPEEAEASDGWSKDDFKGMTLKDVREVARAAGIENWDTATRASLITMLVEGTSGGDEEEVEETPAKKAPAKVAAKPKAAAPKESSGDLDYAVLAKAVVDEFISRLS